MKITVNLTVRDLFTFSMYNSSSGFSGLFNLFFTAGAIFVLAVTWQWETVSMFQRVLLILCALLFSVIQPLILYRKSQKQAKRQGFDAELEMELADSGFRVKLGEVGCDLGWDQIWKVIRIRSMYIVKTGPTRAYLIPVRSVAGREKELEEIFRKNLPKSKRKGLKE